MPIVTRNQDPRRFAEIVSSGKEVQRCEGSKAYPCHCLRFEKSPGHHPQRTRMAAAGSIHPMFWLYQRVAKGAAVSIRFFMAAVGAPR